MSYTSDESKLTNFETSHFSGASVLKRRLTMLPMADVIYDAPCRLVSVLRVFPYSFGQLRSRNGLHFKFH